MKSKKSSKDLLIQRSGRLDSGQKPMQSVSEENQRKGSIRRRFRIVFFVFVLALLYIWLPNEGVNKSLPLVASAASVETKNLDKDIKYKYDLNKDGKKETLSYSVTSTGEYTCRIKIFVNGVTVLSRVVDGYSCTVQICDLNKKDKSLDLSVYSTSDSYCLEDFFLLRYKGKKFEAIKEFNYKTGVPKNISIYRIGGIKKVKGNGTFSIVADTPYYNFKFGCYYVDIPAKATTSKVTFPTASSYTVTGYTKTFQYKLATSMVLYKKASLSSDKLGTLSSGTKFTAKSIKPLSVATNDGAIFVKVKTSAGKTGWIYFPADTGDKQYLEMVPGWG